MGKKGMGWVPDYPDVRDCTLSHEKVKGIQSSLSGSSVEGFDDRAQQLLKLVTMLEKAVPNLNIIPNLPELNQLKEKFQRDADQKLHFVSANFTEGFLSLGSEGKEVQDLQDKLCKLEYLKCEEGKKEFKHSSLAPDAPGYFGEATKAAVKDFQVNQQLKEPNGIYTPATKAELLAWVSIAGKLGQSTYGLRVSGPSVIYIHALLKVANQIFNQKNPDKPLDLFSDITLKEVQELQKNSNKSHSDKFISEDGVVGQATWDLLLKNEDEDLRKECPTPPVPKKKFIDLKEKICKIIEAKMSYEREDNAGETESSLVKVDVSRLRGQLELEPIIEVLIQLAPCIDKGISFEAAIETGFNWLLSMIPLADESDDRLTLLAQRLERGKGYVSSKIFRYDRYERGMSGPAVTYIQERLRAMGYYNAPTTSYFDEQLTQDAVKKFQSARLKQSTLQTRSPDSTFKRVDPDGTFEREDRDYLTGMAEQFINLEAPLPDNLTDSLIADLGGLEEVVSSFNLIDIITTIQQAAKTFDWIKMVRSAVPPNALDASSEATLKRVIQGINDLNNTPEEWQDLAKQFLALLLRLTLHPIARLIAQLISPIGKYSDPQKAFKDGLKRFRAILYLPDVKQIDRILNGLIVNISGDIDGLTKEYEPLVATLAVLKAEFRQEELACEGLDVFEQLQSLMTASRQSVQSISPPEQSVALKNTSQIKLIEKIILEIKDRVDEKLSVNIDRYKIKLSSENNRFGSNGDHAIETIPRIDTIPRRDQTFIRVDPNCDRCSLQLPVTGKMHRALSQPSAPSQTIGECNTTYTTYLILPNAVDLSIWCSDVEDQGELDACTAHAGVALLEYFEKKSFGNALDASSRFLYKVTRNLMHREGDTGASVRETMKAMVLFGVPPEEYCPYDEAKFDEDPSAFCYAFAQNYQTITYFRLDGAGMPARELLAQIKTILVGGFPCMFGFTVYDSIHDKTNPPGHIPYPTLDDKQEGGHAAIAVGYNDYKQIKNATNPGAFLIKNSWSVDWGEGGYGWLPYDYVLNGLARDWWSLIKSEWVESKQFGLSFPDAWTANLGEHDTSFPC